jgi:hypothetical protein
LYIISDVDEAVMVSNCIAEVTGQIPALHEVFANGCVIDAHDVLFDFNDICPDTIHGFKYPIVFAVFTDDLISNDFTEVVQQTRYKGILG